MNVFQTSQEANTFLPARLLTPILEFSEVDRASLGLPRVPQTWYWAVLVAGFGACIPLTCRIQEP
jgi:hypothetical protein